MTRRPTENLSALNFFHSRVDWEAINSRLLDVHWSHILEGKTVKQIYDEIIKVLYEICSELVPLKSKFSNRKIIPRDRRILMRRRNKLDKKCGSSRNAETKIRIRTQIWNIEAALADSIKRERLDCEKKAIESIKVNPKYFYAYARERSSFKYPVGPLKVNGELVGDPEPMSNVLAQQYKSAFSVPKEDCINITAESEVTSRDTDCLRSLNFSEEDIMKSAGRLSASSSAGPDGVAAVLI